MLTAAVRAGGDAEGDGEVRYYQGMHDVAAVLLFELGERPAYALLHRLARCQLRDCTRCANAAAAPPFLAWFTVLRTNRQLAVRVLQLLLSPATCMAYTPSSSAL